MERMIGKLLRQNRCPQSGPATLSEDSEQKDGLKEEGRLEGRQKEKEGNRNRWFRRNNCTSGEVGGK